MNRSSTKTLLLTAAACLAAALCPPAAAEQAKPPAATQPTTQPAKVNITVGKDTTYITGPLNEDGTVNYLAYLNAKYGKGVTPRNNAMVLLARAVGPEAWGPPHYKSFRDKAFKAMGIAPLPFEGDYFVTLDQYDEPVATEAPPPRTPAQKAAAKRTMELMRKIEAGEISKAEMDELAAMPSTQADVVNKTSDQVDEAMKGPWSPKKLPLVAVWLKANAKPLALVVQATKRPRFYHPMVSKSDPPRMIDEETLRFKSVIDVTKALSARAMLKLQTGDHDGAWVDVMALRRLARLISQNPTLIHHAVGMSMEVRACKCTAAAVTSGRFSIKRLRACLADMRALAPLPDIRQAVTGERFWALDAVMMLARGEGKADAAAEIGTAVGRLLTGVISKRLIDWDQMLRTFNHWHDRLASALAERDIPKRRRACEKLDSDLKDLAAQARKQTSGAGLAKFIAKAVVGLRSDSLTKNLAGHLVSLLMPSLGTIVDRYDAALTREELVRSAASLALHKAETGQFPPKLADLAPKYLRALPGDRFSGKALLYRRQGKGCVVYSVGMNLKDDAGVDNRKNEYVPKDSEKDDIVVRFKR